MSEGKPVHVDVYRHGNLEVDKELGNEISVENKDEILVTGKSRKDVYTVTAELKKRLGGDVYAGETKGVAYGLIVTDIDGKSGKPTADLTVEDKIKDYVGGISKVKVRGKGLKGEELSSAIERAGKE